MMEYLTHFSFRYFLVGIFTNGTYKLNEDIVWNVWCSASEEDHATRLMQDGW